MVPSMLSGIRHLYGRILPAIAALWPFALLPFLTELLQHIVEIRLGLYQSGLLTPADRQIRLAFGLVKLTAIVILILVALRWWRFGGDKRRMLRPSWALAQGVLVYVVLELADAGLEEWIGTLTAGLVEPGHASAAARDAVHFAPTALWTFLSGLWLPWNIGLLVDDPTMTLRRSLGAAIGNLWIYFGLLVAGTVPLMAVHYALGLGAVGQVNAVVWALAVVDAGVVVLLTVSIGSSFYSVYERAAARGSADRIPPVPAG